MYLTLRFSKAFTYALLRDTVVSGVNMSGLIRLYSALLPTLNEQYYFDIFPAGLKHEKKVTMFELLSLTDNCRTVHLRK